ncbi:MAG: hypothetical protein LUF04_10420, partial [Bacteroides sp.]|nr:hypothetical protein [Bacteroides sp.]
SELWRNDSAATGKRTLGCEVHRPVNLEEVAAIRLQEISCMQPFDFVDRWFKVTPCISAHLCSPKGIQP